MHWSRGSAAGNDRLDCAPGRIRYCLESQRHFGTVVIRA